MTIVLPSILSDTEEETIAKMTMLPLSIDMIHLDIMDGTFVPRTFWADPKKIRNALPPTMRYEAHFMVADPIAYCHLWANGNDDARMVRMIFHVSAITNASSSPRPLAPAKAGGGSSIDAPNMDSRLSGNDRMTTITELETCVRAAEKEFWIAWNPNVSFERVQVLLPHVDGVLVMGDMPGFSGRKGVGEKTSARIRQIRAIHATIPINVDIGVNNKTAPLFRVAGATHLVSGSYIFSDRAGVADRIAILANA